MSYRKVRPKISQKPFQSVFPRVFLKAHLFGLSLRPQNNELTIHMPGLVKNRNILSIRRVSQIEGIVQVRIVSRPELRYIFLR